MTCPLEEEEQQRSKFDLTLTGTGSRDQGRYLKVDTPYCPMDVRRQSVRSWALCCRKDARHNEASVPDGWESGSSGFEGWYVLRVHSCKRGLDRSVNHQTPKPKLMRPRSEFDYTAPRTDT